MQEIHHARRITLRSGSHELDWASILIRNYPSVLHIIYEMEMFRKTRDHMTEAGSNDYGLDVLETYEVRECLDPSDAVYALRSLVPSLMFVIPNYLLSIAEVFTAAARAIISRSGRLSLLEKKSRETPSTWSL